MKLLTVRQESMIPKWTSRDSIAQFLHEHMKPYEDTVTDIQRSLDYVFSKQALNGGFVVLGEIEERLVGVLVMLHTGMKGYVPENLLLFVTVRPENRHLGLGRQLISWGLQESEGNVKLHVEYDNPAKSLYESVGFKSKYAEMRYVK